MTIATVLESMLEQGNFDPAGLESLIQQNLHDLYLMNQEGLTPLHYAIKMNCIEAVVFLISKHRELDSSWDINRYCTRMGETVLGYAIASDPDGVSRIPLVKILLEQYNAKPTVRNTAGVTSIEYAVENRYYQYVHMIMEFHQYTYDVYRAAEATGDAYWLRLFLICDSVSDRDHIDYYYRPQYLGSHHYDNSAKVAAWCNSNVHCWRLVTMASKMLLALQNKKTISPEVSLVDRLFGPKIYTHDEQYGALQALLKALLYVDSPDFLVLHEDVLMQIADGELYRNYLSCRDQGLLQFTGEPEVEEHAEFSAGL